MRFCLILVLAGVFILSLSQKVFALSPEEEIKILKEQIKVLLGRVEKLEEEIANTKETKPEEKIAEKKEEPLPAMLKNVGTKLKISGRWAGGYYDSEENGSSPDGSFQAPDAKLRFDFQLDKINTIVMRLNLNNATFNNLDYLYLDTKDFLPFLKDTPFTLESRLGKFKVDYGEETWSNNQVENALVSNSASNVTGYDKGVQLSGQIKVYEPMPVKWSTSLTHGNTGSITDNENSKAFSGKIAINPTDDICLSASYYHSDDLESANSEMSIAGINSAPTNAVNWTRQMWEIDARYDFKKGEKPLASPVYTDSAAYIRGAFGQFWDDAESRNRLAVQDRDGTYGFIEGLYNINPKLYAAYRYSIIDLDAGQTASLNGITCNKHQRHSLGLGWRWTEKTILKAEYTWNKEDNVAPNKGSQNDQVSAVVSSSF
ncbi:MAG: hypothetical protein AMJ78_09710 [Omnitrophica WOR_2 bacterium SM23_29]|nr:MAG: hypothetical protein AMJ78_09710 [Omnitrophica WOR_2 bacterium SM23_29]